MKRSAVPRLAALAITVVGFVSSAFGQSGQVEFGIYGAGNGVLGGVYTDPYQGFYNGNAASLALGDGSGDSTAAQKAFWNQPSGTSTAVGAFCDDFTNDVSPPQYWTSLDTNLSAFTGTGSVQTVYYTTAPGASSYTNVSGINSGTLSQTADYVAMSWLAYESTLATASNPTAQEQYSYALWDIEDPSLLGSDCSKYGCLDNGHTGISSPTAGSNWSAALTDVAEALNVGLAYASTGDGGAAFASDPCEYNPNGALCGDKQVTVNIFSAETSLNSGIVEPSSDTSRPQEFITVTQGSAQSSPLPEPSSLASLGLDLIGAGIVGLLYRRRQLRKS